MTELLSGKSHEQYSPLRLGAGLHQHTCGFHHRTDTGTAVNTSCRYIISIQMTTHDNILVRILAALDRRYHIVIFDWTQFKVIADIELQLKSATFLHHLLDDSKLVLIQFDVRNLWNIIEGGVRILYQSAVIERTQRNWSGLDETESSGLAHFPVIQASCLSVMCPDLFVLFKNLSVLFLDLAAK